MPDQEGDHSNCHDSSHEHSTSHDFEHEPMVIESGGGGGPLHEVDKPDKPELGSNGAPATSAPPEPSYTLKPGATLSNAAVALATGIGQRYKAKTGKTIVITRGKSTAKQQAQAMYNSLVADDNQGKYGQSLSKYKLQDVAKDILQAYADNLGGESAVAAIEKVIADSAAAGKPISKHLADSAFDVRNSDMTPLEKVAFIQEATRDPDVKVIVETTGDKMREAHQLEKVAPGKVSVGVAKDPHFHVQVSQILIRPDKYEFPRSFVIIDDHDPEVGAVRRKFTRLDDGPYPDWKEERGGDIFRYRGSGHSDSGDNYFEQIVLQPEKHGDHFSENLYFYVPDPQYSIFLLIQTAGEDAKPFRMLEEITFDESAGV